MGYGRRQGSAASPVSDRLKELVAEQALAADLQQAEAARALDRIAIELRSPPGGLLGLGRPKPVRGAYLVGAVGRGKTMLMDVLVDTVELDQKLRAHFHEFMDEVHAAIADFRRMPRGRAESADPVAAAVQRVLGDTRLLCLDEFQVHDITNAMLLGRLFGKLFDRGVTLVATSNTAPDDLYAGGLNRQLVLPFIAELKRHVDLVPLSGPTDYRREKFEGEHVFVFAENPRPAMDRLWLRLTGGLEGEPASLFSLGRKIRVPRAAMGAARFSFPELCESPLGARDYLRLAHAFDTLMIDEVPTFTRANSDAARRFILLVDTLYDRGVKLSASFAAPLDALGADERTAAEFERTVSRLIEMQSADYLRAAHKPEAVPVA
jgi:cell division protein ZapE